MKKLLFAAIGILLITGFSSKAQDDAYPRQQQQSYERFGRSLNVGIGVGYFGYLGHSMAVLHADYEIDAARNFTLAPFMNLYSYRDYSYWGDQHNQYKYYYYHETVAPVGIKGTYYLDHLLQVNKKWDVYVAGSFGVVLRSIVWENGYNGNTEVGTGMGILYLDFHIGGEYHVTRATGVFVDFSTGVSTIGLGFHI